MKNNFFNPLLSSVLAAASVALVSSAFAPVRAATLSFPVTTKLSSESTTAKVDLTLTDLAGGQVKFDLDVDESVNLADIRGIFFNIANNSLLSGLNITGPDVSDFATDPNGQLDSLGGGNQINPGGPFEIAVEIGESGLKGGTDDIRLTSFIVSSTSGSVDVSQFANQLFGVRLQSVGANREGSSKLGTTAPPVVTNPPQPPTSVPEPSTTAALGLFGMGAIGYLKKNKKSI